MFPRLGAGIKPVAGSAVFWYNIYPDGRADTLTLHGACPILFGTKWGKCWALMDRNWINPMGQSYGPIPRAECPWGLKILLE